MKATILAIGLVGTLCLGYSSAKDPDLSQMVFEGQLDTAKLRQRNEALKELREVLLKLRAGTDTQADDRRAILLLVKVLGVE